MADGPTKNQDLSISSTSLAEQPHPRITCPKVSNERLALIRSLSRAFGLSCSDTRHPDDHFLNDVSMLFRKQVVNAEYALEKHDQCLPHSAGGCAIVPRITLRQVGYSSFFCVLFELIAHRYDRHSLITTSNQDFEHWDKRFEATIMTVAAIDRLVHHATILQCTGKL